MRWYELCDNPSAVTSNYSDASVLDALVITELTVAGDSLRVFGDLIRPPDNCAPGDVARLGLAFWNVVDLAVAGMPDGTPAALSLSKLPDGHLRFEMSANEFRLSVQSKQAMIESFRVFSDEYVRRNTQTLFSYHNVWNSCLFVLRSEGFELSLYGDPDPQGGPSHCQWNANRDGLELKAANPIELLGLADLARRAEPQPPRDYWWRKNGPNIVSELYDIWRKKRIGPFVQ